LGIALPNFLLLALQVRLLERSYYAEMAALSAVAIYDFVCGVCLILFMENVRQKPVGSLKNLVRSFKGNERYSLEELAANMRPGTHLVSGIVEI
jgi:hypothetical protein